MPLTCVLHQAHLKGCSCVFHYAAPLMIGGHQVGLHVERFPPVDPAIHCLPPLVTADIFIIIAGEHWCAASTVLR